MVCKRQTIEIGKGGDRSEKGKKARGTMRIVLDFLQLCEDKQIVIKKTRANIGHAVLISTSKMQKMERRNKPTDGGTDGQTHL